MSHVRIVRHPEAFSLDPRTGRKRGREKNMQHLDFIRQLPSLVTGSRVNVEAAHVRYADPAHYKSQVGIGEKPDDIWAVPLSAELHRLGLDAQHANNEREWWKARGIDPLAVAGALARCTGDIEKGEAIIYRANRGARA